MVVSHLPVLCVDLADCLDGVEMIETRINTDLVENNDTCCFGVRLQCSYRI